MLILAGCIANREADFTVEKACGLTLVALMTAAVLYGVLRLEKMQADCDARRPPGLDKHHAGEAGSGAGAG